MNTQPNPWVHTIAVLTLAACAFAVVVSLCIVVVVEHDGETTREIVNALVWITGFCVASLAGILGVLPAVLSKMGAGLPTGIPGMQSSTPVPAPLPAVTTP